MATEFVVWTPHGGQAHQIGPAELTKAFSLSVGVLPDAGNHGDAADGPDLHRRTVV